ncbi:phosphotransferase family protein [Sphingomonas sp. TX0522]|jgi:aminoglycoside phosphotransferase (APT) family kinase protein|uniref:phosphotransferase family protein n=1 Tax=Sphingomonas sp. TX0522 TaxID=2479205 RepID=UPI0018E02C19|nr:phosphotransferase family protein [Sphingomonas sp. TX0522]MBI0531992.1 phosphotransferase family protein [Sphingomonas sp. TX0522]
MKHPTEVDGRCIVAAEPLAGGRSNPTALLIAEDGARFVLRTRPPGETNPTAHRIDREVRVLRALAGCGGVPVPRVVAWEPSPASGEAHYVMNFVPGFVPEDPVLDLFDPRRRRRTWESAVDALAALHAVDPTAVGLDDFGAPGEYNARQLARWRQRNAEAEQPAALDVLGRTLEDRPPRQNRRTVVHGDYRLGNWIVNPADGSLAAVIDWELSTLGDPLSDLAYLTLSWLYPRRGSVLPGLAGATPPPGTPSVDELVTRYAAATGAPLPDDWPRHRALALFRSASIALGVFRRRAARAGTVPSTDDMAVVEALAVLGRDLLPFPIRSPA